MERETTGYRSKFDKGDLVRVFPQKGADDYWNFGIIAIHGNEPQRLVAAVALQINEILSQKGLRPVAFVLPDIYGEDSKRILREEFPENTGNIFIDKRLGAILKQTEFSSAGYQAHLQEVADNQPMVYEQALEHLSRPFLATSLDGETREFLPRGRRIEINGGANVVASAPGEKGAHFYFPVQLSELVAGILEDSDINFTYDPKALESVLKYTEEFEKTYLTTQLSYVHTFSYKDDYPTEGKIFTPSPKKLKIPPDVDIENGIYVMTSGSGLGVDVVKNQAERLASQGYQIVAPSWMNLEFATVASPEAIFHPGVKAVIGRAGWGILWDAQKAGKPFADIGLGEYDNPEIRFNRRSIVAAGLGLPFSLRQGFIEELIELSSGIERLNQKIERDLNFPHSEDGARFTAETILGAEIDALNSR